MMLKQWKWYERANAKRQNGSEWKNARILNASTKCEAEKRREKERKSEKELCNFAN